VTLEEYPRSKVIALFANLPPERGGFRLFLMPKWAERTLLRRFGMNASSSPRIIKFDSADEIPKYTVGETVKLDWQIRPRRDVKKSMFESVVTLDDKVVYRATVVQQQQSPIRQMMRRHG